MVILSIYIIYFHALKMCGFFWFSLISLDKNNFLPSCCRKENKFSFHAREVDFACCIVNSCIVKFYDIIRSYIFQQLLFHIRVKQLSQWNHLFLRKTKFPSDNFENSASIKESSCLKTTAKKQYLFILIPKTKSFEVKVKC